MRSYRRVTVQVSITLLFFFLSYQLISRYSTVVYRPIGSDHGKTNTGVSTPTAAPPAPTTDRDYPQRIVAFWDSFSKIVFSNRPKCPAPKKLNEGATTVGYNPLALENATRPHLINMSRVDVEEMKAAHTEFVSRMVDSAPKLPYRAGTRGLVTTAGGPYMPTLVVSLRMLRLTGSRLPVEVFLASHSEFEPRLCDHILPSLNARCVVLSDILEAVPEPLEIEKYQFKVFAMLFSSFEDILFFDADNMVIYKPEELFNSEPYVSTGMVTWPDFWASTASDLFYEITSQPPPPLSARASTESGQVLISKKSHATTLFLAVYYNYWGPEHYYPLLSQGAPGEGDKETFIAAAMALNAPFYSVKERVSAIGYKDLEGEWHGTAMVQYHPFDDYNLTKHNLSRLVDESVAPTPRRAFVHANFPKVNPSTILTDKAVTKYSNGTRHRMWGPREDTIEKFGKDLEKDVWEQVMYVGCDLEHEFASWRLKKGICDEIKVFWKEVLEKEERRHS
ncbi:MAG: hypothetical protein M1824_003356 [Vezdaea acicularis]|nr:MAG: hypothetical protein M1824_003356 [Vezdaea acicularis]